MDGISFERGHDRQKGSAPRTSRWSVRQQDHESLHPRSERRHREQLQDIRAGASALWRSSQAAPDVELTDAGNLRVLDRGRNVREAERAERELHAQWVWHAAVFP